MSIDTNRVSLITRFVKVLVEANKKENCLKEADVDEYINMSLTMIADTCTDEEIAAAKRDITYHYLIYTEPGKAIVADYDDENWYDDAKSNITPKFWSRYRDYLIDEKHFNPNIVSTLSDDTIDMKLMNYIGNPDSSFGLKRGLIIGDVQSGKTSTYIGLMCKAADAGYKVFILLTGTIESLRQQTQERVEEGFVGIDMSAQGGEVRVGVGKDNKPIIARALTSRQSDFNSQVDKIAVTLGHSDAVVFVIKKQKNILENLRDWLVNLNADPITKKIDAPMLLIDDEADNASIHTGKSKEDPTVINKLIRELLNIFSNANYVGFTATPFANVFIDPVKTEEMENQDLFPEDFIVALPTPSNYIGANRIFKKDGDYHHQLVYIKDAGSVEEDGWPFYFKHKKEWQDSLPDSLTDAIYTFYLANALRDLRCDNQEHRSMLINISRFVKVQKYIKSEVEEIHKNAYTSIKFNLSHNFDESMKDPILKRIYKNWIEQYQSCEFTWDQVVDVLFSSIENIQIKVVNSSRGSEKLEYPKKESLRVIAIGGLALSRGLTLEGLIVSYFFRNTNTYDVLMQMGRWFGYRKNYDDLFRIWTHKASAEWYAEIAEATDTLKHDMDIMRDKKLKPKSFGIRVRNDCQELRITAPNKMRSTTDEYEFTEFFGELYETPYLSAKPKTNIQNYTAVKNLVGKCLENNINWELIRTIGAGEHNMLRNVPKSLILSLLSDIKVSKYCAYFDVNQIKDYISNGQYSELDKWDIVFMDGGDSGKTHSIHGKTIQLVKRHKCSIEPSLDKLSLGRRGKLGGPTDGMMGLDSDTIAAAKKAFDLDFFEREKEEFCGTYPSNTWFKYVANRNPMLIIYLIDVKMDAANNQQVPEKEYLEGMSGIPSAGFAIGLPKNAAAVAKKVKYRVSCEYNYFEMKENENEVEEEE